MKRRDDIYERKEKIIEWIYANESKASICRKLNCKYETLEGFLKEWNISYKGNKSSKGIEDKGYKSALVYIENDKFISSSRLLKKLLKEGIKEKKCERCGLTEWLGEEIPLELHHKNGNHYDNRLENLQILCPNCHTFTENYCGKKNLYKESNGQNKILKSNRWEQIKNSNIDFSKFGWVSKLSKLWNIPVNSAGKYVKKNFPEFYKTCFIRNKGNAQ